jgi:hypothetical protein
MTEQEIIDYLKKNKSEGRIISFMPEEVKRWCEEHLKELLVWQNHRWYKFDVVYISTNDAVTLPDDYKVKEETGGEWDEYNIKDGRFYEETRGLFYTWHEWSKCMLDNPRFTAFGGWQYEDSKRWYLAPAVKLQDGEMWNSYVIEQSGEATPVAPVKIRFWREAK